jgi:multicomponent Na+:H+ antiporter subunit G
MKEIFSSFFILVGSFFVFIAALGVLRMPELYMRIHSSTKAGTLGLGFILVGVALFFQELSIVMRALATMAFIVLTAPVAAHLIGRAGYKTGVSLWKGTYVNELTSGEMLNDKESL